MYHVVSTNNGVLWLLPLQRCDIRDFCSIVLLVSGIPRIYLLLVGLLHRKVVRASLPPELSGTRQRVSICSRLRNYSTNSKWRRCIILQSLLQKQTEFIRPILNKRKRSKHCLKFLFIILALNHILVWRDSSRYYIALLLHHTPTSTRKRRTFTWCVHAVALVKDTKADSAHSLLWITIWTKVDQSVNDQFD